MGRGLLAPLSRTGILRKSQSALSLASAEAQSPAVKGAYAQHNRFPPGIDDSNGQAVGQCEGLKASDLRVQDDTEDEAARSKWFAAALKRLDARERDAAREALRRNAEASGAQGRRLTQSAAAPASASIPPTEVWSLVRCILCPMPTGGRGGSMHYSIAAYERACFTATSTALSTLKSFEHLLRSQAPACAEMSYI